MVSSWIYHPTSMAGGGNARSVASPARPRPRRQSKRSAPPKAGSTSPQTALWPPNSILGSPSVNRDRHNGQTRCHAGGVMRAVTIPLSGAVTVIDLTKPTDDDTRPFLTELYATISCDSVECVRLSGMVDAWLDETGLVDRKPMNQRATRSPKRTESAMNFPESSCS